MQLYPLKTNIRHGYTLLDKHNIPHTYLHVDVLQYDKTSLVTGCAFVCVHLLYMTAASLCLTLNPHSPLLVWLAGGDSPGVRWPPSPTRSPKSAYTYVQYR